MIEFTPVSIVVAASLAALSFGVAVFIIGTLLRRLNAMRAAVRSRDELMATRIGAAVEALQAMRDDVIAKTASEREMSKRHSRDWLTVISQLEKIDHTMKAANHLLGRVVEELRAGNTLPPAFSALEPIEPQPDFGPGNNTRPGLLR